MLETLCVRITNHCNLECYHCRAGSSPKTKEHNDLKKLKFFISELVENGLKHISISGGEPGVDFRVGDLIRFCIDKGLYITITSNGTAKLVENLIRFGIQPNFKIKIRYSLDGSEVVNDKIRGKGSFQKTIWEIEITKKWLGWVGINTVLMPIVYNDFKNFTHTLSKINFDELALITPVSQGSGGNIFFDKKEDKRNIENCLKNLKNKKCFPSVVVWDFADTPNTSILLNPKGEIILTGISNFDNEVIGHIDNFDIEEINNKINNVKSENEKTFFSWNPKRWKQSSVHQDNE